MTGLKIQKQKKKKVKKKEVMKIPVVCIHYSRGHLAPQSLFLNVQVEVIPTNDITLFFDGLDNVIPEN